jgi:hypothetical protein
MPALLRLLRAEKRAAPDAAAYRSLAWKVGRTAVLVELLRGVASSAKGRGIR